MTDAIDESNLNGRATRPEKKKSMSNKTYSHTTNSSGITLPSAWDNVLFCSYGNDSIALIQWMAEHGESGVVAYSDTGWSAPEWQERVVRGEAYAKSLGFDVARIQSQGMESLVRQRKGWPRQGMQFCTQDLKIRPAADWLAKVDPDGEAVCCVGVRREESRSRMAWPEHTEVSDKHGGRSLWAPLVRHTTSERDALLQRAGFQPLTHRSMECFPCINSNRSDLVRLSNRPDRVREIADLESDLGFTSKGKPRTMFRPYRHMGAVGIEEIIKWALSERGGYGPPGACDSGMCEGGD